ncbi:MAG: 50S ribosomal protein L17 [Bacteroidota bacterium]
MRHGKKINHLSRTSAHRQAMLANMASSLIKSKRINTTLTKAKALRTYIEPLITRSKEDSTHSRRVVFSYLQDKEAVTELFREVATKVAQRPGGYTRILKTDMRYGDNAQMCMMELVDYNENLMVEKQEKKAKTTRRGRAGSKKITAQKTAETETVVRTHKKETAKKEAGEAVEKTDVVADNVKTDKTPAEDNKEKEKIR